MYITKIVDSDQQTIYREDIPKETEVCSISNFYRRRQVLAIFSPVNKLYTTGH